MKPSPCSHDPASWQEMAFQEVLTLHVRAFAGEQRAQALGEVVKTRVCPACLQACVENSLDEKRSLRQLILRYGLISLAGVKAGSNVNLNSLIELGKFHFFY